MLHFVAQNYPYVVCGFMAIVAPEMFRHLYKSFEAIEADEKAQGREKDWYLSKY